MMNTRDGIMTTSEILNAVSRRLYEIANENDWSLGKLAIQCGVSYKELYYIMYSKRDNITLSTLVKISQNLNEPLANLIGIGMNPIRDYMKAILQLHREAEGYLKRGASL